MDVQADIEISVGIVVKHEKSLASDRLERNALGLQGEIGPKGPGQIPGIGEAQRLSKIIRTYLDLPGIGEGILCLPPGEGHLKTGQEQQKETTLHLMPP